jgi:iron complex outermembrane receptor protein
MALLLVLYTCLSAMRSAFVLLFICITGLASSQSMTDSTQQLGPVLIQAYATEKTLDLVAASVGYLGPDNFQRFNNTNLLPALNTIPGVRMEERSPGSYRFSIRGSLLRSPFGVRNVKVYWNGLPFTDGGGNTYLNLLDFSSVGSTEIVKGPGGSLYGAGTGGVVLLYSPTVKKNQTEFQALSGSNGLQRYSIAAQIHREKVNARVQFAHQQSDGYREQTQMTRDAIHADIKFLLNSSSALSATFLYTDLFYQTPGGLTIEQYTENARQARPAGGPNRGAVDQRAAVSNQTLFFGLNFEKDWNEKWSTRLGVVGANTAFSNPTIRNYEIRDENNLGVRMENQFVFGSKKTSKLTFGGEYQFFKSRIRVHDNDYGLAGLLQTRDELNSGAVMFFGQVEYDLPQNFFLTVGASINLINVDFKRTDPALSEASRDLDPYFSPRIALLNRVTPDITIFASMSRGFSPPGIAELYPSRQVFDRDIQAERGINLEAGIRGMKIKSSIDFDIAVYQFKLKDALVIRRDATLPGDPEYFVNAGKTIQKGIEALVTWHPIRNKKTIVSDLKIWNSYTYNHYRFENYVQDENDYSGNKLTGIAPVVNTSGIDMVVKKRIYLNVTGNYVDHTPLDDANTAFASEYFLVGARLGFKTNIQTHQLDVFVGVDNALDKKYSLGNDLNAVAGRYYNVAAARNFYVGARFMLNR